MALAPNPGCEAVSVNCGGCPSEDVRHGISDVFDRHLRSEYGLSIEHGGRGTAEKNVALGLSVAGAVGGIASGSCSPSALGHSPLSSGRVAARRHRPICPPGWCGR